MSLRKSVSCPWSCSGAMYCSVPAMAPSLEIGCLVVPFACAAVSSGRGFAMPKSSSFAPLFVRMTFEGLRSRWTMPAECAAASAPAISMP